MRLSVIQSQSRHIGVRKSFHPAAARDWTQAFLFLSLHFSGVEEGYCVPWKINYFTSILLQTKNTVFSFESFTFIYFLFHLYVLRCSPADANRLSYVSASLSPLPFLFGSYLSRFSFLCYTSKIDFGAHNRFYRLSNDIYRVIQIIGAHTDGCRSRPSLAYSPVSGPSEWRCFQTLTLLFQFIFRVDGHAQSGNISVYWLWLLLYVSAVSVGVVIIAICDMPRQEFSLFEHVYIHNTYNM